jgi:hypothetical protein
MPAAIGPRFVLEAGFLVLLAVVVGFADLSPALIILVMTVAWLLVALIEYFAWRQGQGLVMARRFDAAPAPVMHEEVVEEMAPPPPPPPPPPAPPPPEAETIVAPLPTEPAPPAAKSPAEEEKPPEFRPEPGGLVLHALEPLQPRPRRRWGVFGPRVRREAPAEGDREEER